MTRTTPFNQDIHDNLVAMGYVPTLYECTFEDVGDAENGPELTGDPAFDEYKGPAEYVIVDESGHVVHREERDLVFEAWIEEQEAKWA